LENKDITIYKIVYNHMIHGYMYSDIVEITTHAKHYVLCTPSHKNVAEVLVGPYV
jgi:hypothetical protein